MYSNFKVDIALTHLWSQEILASPSRVQAAQELKVTPSPWHRAPCEQNMYWYLPVKPLEGAVGSRKGKLNLKQDTSEQTYTKYETYDKCCPSTELQTEAEVEDENAGDAGDDDGQGAGEALRGWWAINTDTQDYNNKYIECWEYCSSYSSYYSVTFLPHPTPTTCW